MMLYTWAQLALYLAIMALIAPPVGRYVQRVMAGIETPLARLSRPLERTVYRVCGVDPRAEMTWSAYTLGLVIFNILGVFLFYGIQRAQDWLPLNPSRLVRVTPDGAFNTAVSFTSNTSWQSYAGESTLSYLSQMLGVTAQSFLSGATGIAVLIALLRGFSRVGTRTVGNVWVDLTRATWYVLMPLAIIGSVLLVSQGCLQSLSGGRNALLLEPTLLNSVAAGRAAVGRTPISEMTIRAQLLPGGPVASQTAVALLSGDGGGFFNANSAHPFANPTPLSNLLEMIAILLIPAALCHTFGAEVGDQRQGWSLFVAMALVFVSMSAFALGAEEAGNPHLRSLGVDQSAGAAQSGGNMEGKETRFGIVGPALFAVVTTSGGDGAVNSMHDSFMPVGGLVPLALMQLGEVIFGGPGSGLYGMLVYAIAAVFVASLMIGRAPEYLGKQIAAFEMKMVSIALLITPMLVLMGTAISVSCMSGRAGPGNPGAHGFSEILYAFSSAANNNGSAFSGLSANTPYYNVAIGVVMWLGRFVPLLAVMGLAGSLAAKKRRQPGPGTLQTHGLLFIGMLLGTVLLVGALTYVPALAMGPVVEQIELGSQP
jgi:potassium-transporting ATPase potassium-binding subunit